MSERIGCRGIACQRLQWLCERRQGITAFSVLFILLVDARLLAHSPDSFIIDVALGVCLSE